VDTTTAVLTTVIIVIGLAVTLIAGATSRRRAERLRRRGLPRARLPLREVPGYAAVPLMIASAIEADRPLHLSFGSAGVGGSSTLLAAAGAAAFEQIARRAATGQMPPLVTMSEATAIALGVGTLRRAYRDRGRLERLNRAAGRGGARWFPQGDRSLTFAAAITTMMHDENTAGSVLLGGFGPEIGLMLDAAARRRQIAVAGTDQLEGQAVAFALADEALIGEELFAAPTYLNAEPGDEGRVIAIDTLRWLLIAVLVAAAVIVLREPVSAALAGLGR
jgi:hypothetical protein